MNTPRENIPFGLDTDPEDDPEFIYSQPRLHARDLDPGETDNPYLRSVMIDLRRAAGLPDYPEHPAEPRSAAD